jgi:hypothetical protein
MASIDSSTGQIVTPPAPTIAPVPVPTATSVYSAPNITQAATNPVAPVNAAVEEYNAYMNTPELTAARTSVSELQQAINSERAGLRNTTTGLEYQNDSALGTTGASMNLIGRQVGRANELSSNRQAALGDQFSAATAYLQGLENTRKEQFNVYTQEKQRIQSLIAQTGNQAGILPTDTFEVATEKAFKWEKDQKKKADKKAKEASDKAEKDALKSAIAKLGGSTKGKKGGSLSTKELKKKYEDLTGSAYKKEQSRSDQEFAMKVAEHNKKMTTNDTVDDKEYEKKLTQLNSDVDKWKLSMKDDKASWADAFGSIQRTYGLDANDIDALLGLDYRDKYDK